MEFQKSCQLRLVCCHWCCQCLSTQPPASSIRLPWVCLHLEVFWPWQRSRSSLEILVWTSRVELHRIFLVLVNLPMPDFAVRRQWCKIQIFQKIFIIDSKIMRKVNSLLSLDNLCPSFAGLSFNSQLSFKSGYEKSTFDIGFSINLSKIHLLHCWCTTHLYKVIQNMVEIIGLGFKKPLCGEEFQSICKRSIEAIWFKFRKGNKSSKDCQRKVRKCSSL